MSADNPSALEEARARRALPAPSMRRAIRENAGVPLRRVAEDIGVTAQAVALWEAGQRAPRAQYLVRYVALLDALREVAR